MPQYSELHDPAFLRKTYALCRLDVLSALDRIALVAIELGAPKFPGIEVYSSRQIAASTRR